MSDRVRIQRFMECARCSFSVRTTTEVPLSSTPEELDQIWADTLRAHGWRQRPVHRFSKKLRWYCEAHA